MAPDQLGEGGFGALLGKFPEEFGIAAHGVTGITAARSETEQRKCRTLFCAF
jgi:hypothetical protein